MAVTVYRSTDASAPVLSGSANALIAVLDACLVNGYGSKAAAGWTKAYSGTNKASYRQGSPSVGVPPIRYYLDVDDTGPGTSTTKEARIRGYETMTAVGTGTNAFPASNICARKSAATGATTRAWTIIADETTLYMFVDTGDVASTYFSWGFGEYYSYVSADQYKCFILGRFENNALVTGGGLAGVSNTTSRSISASSAFNCARPFTGVGTPTANTRTTPFSNVGSGGSACGIMSSGAGGVPFPNPVDGGIFLAPVNIWTQPSGGSFGLHGQHRGLYDCAHGSTPFSDGDTFDGVGAYAGRSFMVVKQLDAGNTSATACAIILETTAWARST